MSRIAPLFPADVLCEDATPDHASVDDLFPAERALVARAVDRRKREFAAARACARRALGRFGFAPAPLLNAEDRAPIWPEGIVGSITHTHGYCAVAVARWERVASVGVDVETAAPMDEPIWRRVLTDREITRITASGRTPAEMGRLYFSAKEAFYKCQYPLTRTFLGFHDAEIEIPMDGPAGRFTAVFLRGAGERFAEGDVLEGRFRAEDDYVMTGVTLRR